jgi:CRISPR/Cas system-associated protein Cas10 (large subunit of type III CRISPR-Cas system)
MKIKEITAKDEYETQVHNCFYLMRNARNVMKQYWPKIHIIETSTHRYLQFVKDDKTKTTIDLDSIGDQCGIYLFDGKKEPGLADMMNIDTALGFYFSH